MRDAAHAYAVAQPNLHSIANNIVVIIISTSVSTTILVCAREMSNRQRAQLRNRTPRANAEMQHRKSTIQ